MEDWTLGMRREEKSKWVIENWMLGMRWEIQTNEGNHMLDIWMILVFLHNDIANNLNHNTAQHDISHSARGKWWIAM